MSSLFALWLVSLLISGAALLIMCGLLISRLILARTGRTREAERRRLVPLLLGAGSDESGISRVKGDLLADLAVELIQLVRGSDRERFVATATRMGVPARLRHHLGSGSARIRLSATEALAEFPDQASVERLNAALRDPNQDVRLSAALSLASIGKAPPARELVDLLAIGTTENSLLTVALFRDIAAQNPDDIKALVLDTTVPPGAKAAAIEALSASGDYALVPIITTLAATAATGDVALPRYLKSLGDFGHPAAEPAVRRGLSSPSHEVRAAAAEAAGRIGLSTLAAHLQQLLADPVWRVRFRAGEALARLGEDGAARLRRTAATAGEPARTAAALTLAERGLPA